MVTVELVGPRAELKDHRIPIEQSRERGWGKRFDSGRRQSGRRRFLFRLRQSSAAAHARRGRRSAGCRGRLQLAAGIAPEPGLECIGRSRSRSSNWPTVDWNAVGLVLVASAAADRRSRRLLADLVRSRRAGGVLSAAPARRQSNSCGAAVGCLEQSEPAAAVRNLAQRRGSAARTLERRGAAGRPVGSSPLLRAGGRFHCRWPRSHGGAPLLARVPTRPVAEFTSGQPRLARAIRRWPPRASCCMPSCSGRWRPARPMLGKTRQLDAGEPDGDESGRPGGA